ncbi:MAG TPA: NUDIX domain-containing protein [Candidatus Nitrosopolaris rasttigaisensis]|nr:NUDIX domain-containing protein [Candidatus Nitrosopolaris rasttigaisensis]
MSQLFFQDDYYSIYASERGIDYISMRSEVLIVPLTHQGEVILTIEPSVAFGVPTLVLPGGVIEPGETHEQTALRELQEEIGYTAERLDFLGKVRPFSKYVALESFIYLARELVPSKFQGDEDHPILMEQVSLKDFEHLITSGWLLDARIMAALLMTRHFLGIHNNEVSSGIPKCVRKSLEARIQR